MKTLEEIQSMLDSTVNPFLNQHGGSVELAAIIGEEKRDALIILQGGCKGCAGARYTLNMLVTSAIKKFDDTIENVVDITDHTDTSHAYYKE
jgi:Fe/S biogenesis protein NfuA